MVIVLDDYHLPFFVFCFVRVCIWILGFDKLEALGVLMGFH